MAIVVVHVVYSAVSNSQPEWPLWLFMLFTQQFPTVNQNGHCGCSCCLLSSFQQSARKAIVVVHVVYSAVSNSQPEWPLWLFMLFTRQFPTVSQNGLCGCSCCLLGSFQQSARMVIVVVHVVYSAVSNSQPEWLLWLFMLFTQQFPTVNQNGHCGCSCCLLSSFQQSTRMVIVVVHVVYSAVSNSQPERPLWLFMLFTQQFPTVSQNGHCGCSCCLLGSFQLSARMAFVVVHVVYSAVSNSQPEWSLWLFMLFTQQFPTVSQNGFCGCSCCLLSSFQQSTRMVIVVVHVVYSAVSNCQPEWPLWLFMLFTRQFPTVSQNGHCGCSCCLLSSFQQSARMAFVVVHVVYSAVSNSQPEWSLWLFMLFTRQFPTVSQNGLCGCSCCLLGSFQQSARMAFVVVRVVYSAVSNSQPEWPLWLFVLFTRQFPTVSQNGLCGCSCCLLGSFQQ